MAKYLLNCFLRKWLFLLFIMLCSDSLSYAQELKPADNSSKYKTLPFEEKQKRALRNVRPEPRLYPSERVNFRYAVQKALPGVVTVRYFVSGNKAADFIREMFHRYPPGDYPAYRDITGGSASGVIISPDGYIVTNHHVVKEADSIEILLTDQRNYPAQIVGTDSDTDIALLKIREVNLPFIEFGDSDSAKVGDYVLTIGNPLDLPSTVTAGIISAKARTINILTERSAVESYIQTDAAVTFGNSGGALVDVNGRLLGITAAVATSTGEYAGYSFAVPVEIVKKISNDLLHYKKPMRGYLGMTVSNMNGQKAKSLRTKATTGVLVDSLQLNGAAMRAGIRANDILSSINNYKTETVPQLLGIIVRYRPDDRLKIIVNRAGAFKTINIKLLSEQQALTAANTGKALLKALGIGVSDLSMNEKHRLQIPGGAKIITLTDGEITRNTTMRKDFVILKINNRTINDTIDLIAELLKNKGYVIVEGVYPEGGGAYYYEFRIEGVTFL